MTRREAQSRCPELFVAGQDEDRQARLFEPVVAAVAGVSPGVEVLRPGLLVLAVHGAARFFGSEQAAADRVVEAVAAAGITCQVGIADELSTAVIAARHDTIVAAGGGAQFLAPLPVGQLAAEPSLSSPQRHDLVDLLHRLGLRHIGDFAALTANQVGSRFGFDAIAAHQCARAEPGRPPSPAAPAPDLAVEYRCDPPIDRVDAAAFAGRLLATRLHQRLAAAAASCTRLLVYAETADGEQLSRVWRCAQPLTDAGVADRVRWQLDGWLTHRARNAGRGVSGQGRSKQRSVTTEAPANAAMGHEVAPITLLRLEPVEVVTASALQLGLWGSEGEQRSERARRALTRVQGLLGGTAVRVGVLSGGRGPRERVTLVPLGDDPIPAADPALPWPGRLPEPSPTLVWADPPKVRLTDADGTPVAVTDRGEFTTTPAFLHWRSRQWQLSGWAGPWPDVGGVARVQVLLDDAQALLLLDDHHTWHVEGVYE